MSSIFSRIRKSQTRRLPLQVLFVTTPLVAPMAHAQVTTSLVSTPATPDQPALTNEARPTSSISTSRRATFVVPKQRDMRSLMMSMPDVSEKGTLPAPQPVAATTPAPTPVVVNTVALQPVELAPKPVAAAPMATKPAMTLGAIMGTKVLSSPTTVKSTIAQGSAATRVAANLPARGGSVLNNLTDPGDAPAPAADDTPDAPAVSDSDRVLLAQLDADLAKAQKRLDRAETRLSEGQRQLGAFTNVLQSAMLEAGDDARGLHPFVRVAQRYLGTPYVWGGESARGFDCSGFIMRVMRDLGYRALPHSAAEQFHYGTPIAKSLLKPGDIVFFANTYKPGISHVGIYLGKSRFIHAANSHVGTIVSSLNEPKWVEKYAGARRLIPLNS